MAVSQRNELIHGAKVESAEVNSALTTFRDIAGLCDYISGGLGQRIG